MPVHEVFTTTCNTFTLYEFIKPLRIHHIQCCNEYLSTFIIDFPTTIGNKGGVFEFHYGGGGGGDSTQMPHSAPFLYVHEDLQA